jgi:hypothetical protein
MNRRTALIAGLNLTGLAALAGCQGTPSIFGYKLGSDAIYDSNIKTVYVPTFNNRAFQTTPYRGIEADITRAVVREIGAKTSFKVISDCDRADTEIKGLVIAINKNILNRNQQNLTREGEVVLTVDVLWRDLRTGKNLSSLRRGPAQAGILQPGLPEPEPIPFDPSVPLPPAISPEESWLPVRLVATGRFIPELGESITSAEQRAINQLANQIVSMMEKPW